QGSDMAGVYVHLSGRDVDKAILEAYEKKAQEKRESEKPHLLICDKCETRNTVGSKFCNNCGRALGNELWVEKAPASKKQNGMMGQLMQDPEFRELLLKKMTEVMTNE